MPSVLELFLGIFQGQHGDRRDELGFVLAVQFQRAAIAGQFVQEADVMGQHRGVRSTSSRASKKYRAALSASRFLMKQTAKLLYAETKRSRVARTVESSLILGDTSNGFLALLDGIVHLVHPSR